MKYKVICVLFMFIAQIFVWFQGYAPKYIEWMKQPSIPYLLALPTTFLFIMSIKYGLMGFTSIWSIRIFSFIVGNVVFFIMAKTIVGESLNLKNGLSLSLCLVIVLIQILLKD